MLKHGRILEMWLWRWQHVWQKQMWLLQKQSAITF
jgi:hypothetical protein